MLDLFSSNSSELLDKTQQVLSINIDEVKEDRIKLKDFIVELSDIIKEHSKLYYNKSTPIISDFEYDKLFQLLKTLEQSFPDFKLEDSPTEQVGSTVQDESLTVTHLRPLMSLDNSYNLEDLKAFDKRVKDGMGSDISIEYTVELKYDGSSIALVYENDKLVRAATRGNGIEGEDITENAKVISGIPHQINLREIGISRIEIRGEVVMKIPIFNQLNKEREVLNIQLRQKGKKQLELFKNPRNTAAGSVRMKDVNEVRERRLSAILYQVGYVEDINGNDITSKLKEKHTDYIKLLDNWGFETSIKNSSVFYDIESVSEYCLEWQEKRDLFPIDIDGMVIKVNDNRLQNILGHTAHHPKWAIAYKFKARQAQSILKKVDFQVGRTGAITPVAKIDTINLMGVDISSISLHNEAFIESKDIQIGDTVIIERAGDVIPYIVGSIKEKRDGRQIPISFPENCPSCNHHLVKPDEESIWRCINPDCPAQIEERLIHFASVNAMDIRGLGEEIIRTFLKEEIIHSVKDIYKLSAEDLHNLDGFREKSIQNLLSSIEISKNNESWRLLAGLGIRHIGVTTAKMLTKEVDLLTDFKSWDIEKFLELKDIGFKIAESLYDFFNDKENIDLIQDLEKLGVNIKSTKVNLLSQRLKDKTFLFTGTMTNLSRDDGKRLVEENGGKTISAVSKNLDYLVVGEKAGSKLSKAQKIPSIQIIDETTFLEMLS
ncbi:MAG: NAD-dependent DNA ligase LigA [Chitinophagales bacterium]|nr:NAD-dependent DNA ligase LigA [Chitinophagales bacterium]